MSAPKPFVGYLMVEPDWAPPPKTRTSWVWLLPALYYGLSDAQAEAGGPYGASKVPYKITVTFEPLDGAP